MLTSAREHYRIQQRITAQAVLEAEKAAKKKGPSAVVALVAAYQLLAARTSAQAVAAMLAEQAIEETPQGAAAVTALAGVTSAGFPLEAYFGAIQNVAEIGLAVATQIQDAGRNAELVSMVARADTGYVRMLNLPSCSRCIILAGAWYKRNQGFERHPRCDCRHIPATEAGARGLTTNPADAFESLPTAAELAERYPDLSVNERRKRGLYSQEDIFTKAGAEAIRLGADPIQVVNARRGMRKAQLFSREAWITTEGTTRRGLYGSSKGAEVAGYTQTRVGRRGYVKNQVERRTKRARLMPETLLATADDREEAIRLLKLYGYITP